MEQQKKRNIIYIIERDSGYGWDYCCHADNLEYAEKLLRKCEEDEGNYPCRIMKRGSRK